MPHDPAPARRWRSRPALGLMALCALAATFAGYWLWTSHRGHLAQWWPYAFMLVCPLMHLVMHRGHGGHGAHPARADAPRREDHDTA